MIYDGNYIYICYRTADCFTEKLEEEKTVVGKFVTPEGFLPNGCWAPFRQQRYANAATAAQCNSYDYYINKKSYEWLWWD